MALAQAKAFAADLRARRYDGELVARAALEVTTALLAASPRVSWEQGHGVWWVDAAGLGGEAKLARRLLALAAGCGFGAPRVGVADSAIAAYAASIGPRRGAARRRTGPFIIQSGRDAEFLAPFPLALLDLDDDLTDTLRALGLATVGALAALAPDEVEARFGPEGLAAHRLARGLDPRGPSLPRDDTLPAVAVELGGPVATAEPLLFVLRGALATLGGALREKGLAVRELAMTLSLDDGSRDTRAVRPARPSSHADVLFDHCRAALEGWALPEPVVAVALTAAVTVPAAGEQGDVLAPRWADPAALEAAFDRIRAREGADAVAVPAARDGHLPEDAGAWRCVGDRAAREGRVPRAPRVREVAHAGVVPAALRRPDTPLPVRVRLGRAGLEALKHADTWHDVAGWTGPERLTPRWWATAGGARDYYTARTAAGECCLLFRGLGAHAWFLEGWWD